VGKRSVTHHVWRGLRLEDKIKHGKRIIPRHRHRTQPKGRVRGEARSAEKTPEGKSLKALLAAAPLESIDLDRSADPGREVAL
jgi:hypothetical protein